MDWNINSRNTLSARYNFIDGRMDEYTNSPTEYLFEGAGYTSVSRSHAASIELNSRISNELHNELHVGYTNVVDGRDTEENLPYVEVQGVGANGGGTAYIGTDRYANANSLDQHTLTLTDNLTWLNHLTELLSWNSESLKNILIQIPGHRVEHLRCRSYSVLTHSLACKHIHEGIRNEEHLFSSFKS